MFYTQFSNDINYTTNMIKQQFIVAITHLIKDIDPTYTSYKLEFIDIINSNYTYYKLNV